MKLNDLRPALFFDCDGVLNEEPGPQGATKPDDVILLPGAGHAVQRAREAGRLVVALTNRPQVAKGFITLEELGHILGRFEALLAEDGGLLDRIYFCPHYPEPGLVGAVSELTFRCECRKPGTLMLRWAFADLPIDRRRSALIGDSLRDIGAARGTDLWAYGVRTGHGCRDRERYERETGTTAPVPDLMFDNVIEAVDFELGYTNLAAPALSAIARFDHGEGGPLIVGLCGRSRAGKSVAAHAIARTLTEKDIRCLHVQLDAAAEWERNCSEEARNRVESVQQLVRALRGGRSVRDSGYHVASRGLGRPATYDPAEDAVVLLEGNFAGHGDIRDLLDLIVFVEVPPEIQRTRFVAFHRWEGFDDDAIEDLWRGRSTDEWPRVDRQRDLADLILMSRVN